MTGILTFAYRVSTGSTNGPDFDFDSYDYEDRDGYDDYDGFRGSFPAVICGCAVEEAEQGSAVVQGSAE